MNKLLVLGLLVVLLLPTNILAASTDEINQRVCDRFAGDLNKMAAIMEEVRRREGIMETRVAFEGVDTPIENADYWITYAAEALAYQRAQKYSSNNQLKSALGVQGYLGSYLRWFFNNLNNFTVH